MTDSEATFWRMEAERQDGGRAVSERIRWEEEAGRGYEHIGYVGTLEPWVFRAWESRGAGWTLEAQLPDVPSPPGVLLRDTLDELKAEAERWLEEFVSSLGAVFPEDKISDDEDVQGGRDSLVDQSQPPGGEWHFGPRKPKEAGQ